MIDSEKNDWLIEERKRRKQQWLTISSPILLLVLWELLSRTEIIDSRFFPPPTSIVQTFWDLARSGELFSHVGISLTRIVFGFIAGTIPGILLGLLMGMYRPLKSFFSPLLMALMPIPTLALMPLILILFGIGEISKVSYHRRKRLFPSCYQYCSRSGQHR